MSGSSQSCIVTLDLPLALPAGISTTAILHRKRCGSKRSATTRIHGSRRRAQVLSPIANCCPRRSAARPAVSSNMHSAIASLARYSGSPAPLACFHSVADGICSAVSCYFVNELDAGAQTEPTDSPAGLHPAREPRVRRSRRCETVQVNDGRVRYAGNGSVRLAYRVFGEAETTVVWRCGQCVVRGHLPSPGGSLVLYGTAARFSQELPDFPWGLTPAQAEARTAEIDNDWGSGALCDIFFGEAPRRQGCANGSERSNGRAYAHHGSADVASLDDVDIRGVLQDIRTPPRAGSARRSTCPAGRRGGFGRRYPWRAASHTSTRCPQHV